MSKMTEISEERYEYLLERDAWLDALEQAGVDNWEGYDEALEIYNAFNAE
jgi:acetyl-CoA acetyltransferase